MADDTPLKRPRIGGPNRTETPRADASTINARVETVYRLILKGWGSTQIVQTLAPQLKMSDRNIYNYIKQARTRLEEEAARYREKAFAEHIGLMRTLRKDVYDTDKKLVLQIAMNEAKLLGIYAPEKVAQTTPEGKATPAPAVVIYLPQKDQSPTAAPPTLPHIPGVTDVLDDPDE